MRDRGLYAKILGIEVPWRVEGVGLDLEEGEVVVQVEHVGGGSIGRDDNRRISWVVSLAYSCHTTTRRTG